MSVDPRRADTYLRQLMKMSEDNPERLSPTERRIAGKIRLSQQRSTSINQDLSQLRDQITQGEARVRSLELQAKSEEGKIQALLDFVVEEKFEPEEAMQNLPPPSPPSEGERRDTSPRPPAPEPEASEPEVVPPKEPPKKTKRSKEAAQPAA